MNLDQQLQILIANAPADGATPLVIEQAVAPILKMFASKLRHLEYHVLQSLNQQWVVTTLNSRSKEPKKKTVIYAFPTALDATNSQHSSNPGIIALPVPVTHILFQMFAIPQIDSTIFIENPGNLSSGQEVRRTDLQTSLESQLKQLRFQQPSDLA